MKVENILVTKLSIKDLVQLDFPIDEGYARGNEVWIVSVSETFFGEEPDNSESSSSSGRIEAGFNISFDQIMLKNLKEDWINGASEVHVWNGSIMLI